MAIARLAIPSVLLLLIAIAVIVMLLAPMASAALEDAIAQAALSAHAIERHGSLAVTASQCYDNPELKMYNPQTKRTAYVCLTERGWGIYIANAAGENVTAFVKEKATRLAQVIKYLRNAGYEVIQ